MQERRILGSTCFRYLNSATSVQNVKNISDVPAVFLTARVALIAVCFLYLSIIMCFSAFCLLDMRRQEAGKKDVLCCSIAEEKDEEDAGNKCVGTWLSRILYDGVFRPFILDVSPMEKLLSHGLLWTIGGLMIGLAIWGITEREVGLGLVRNPEIFFFVLLVLMLFHANKPLTFARRTGGFFPS